MRTAMLQKQLHYQLPDTELTEPFGDIQHTQWALKEGVNSLEDVQTVRVWIRDANLDSNPHTGALTPKVQTLATYQPTQRQKADLTPTLHCPAVSGV